MSCRLGTTETATKMEMARTTIAEKSNTLLYFEHLSTNDRLATLIINSSLTPLFVSLLGKAATVTTLKHRLSTLLALLLRHTTYVSAAVARGHAAAAARSALSIRPASARSWSCCCARWKGELRAACVAACI